ncbi:glycosyltransferase family protein [Paludifilum halophilum]|uniref:glycosyltransferase family protein n=1 Tax=Paludifilum halophilum TaxID=1642702 RepID=UPI00146C2EC3|nr:DNRLRE domain-containing protein [Paludifilum halophilum]
MPRKQITPDQLAHQLEEVRPDIILATGWTPLQREPYFRVINQYCNRYNAFHVFWSFEDPLHTETWGMYYAETGKPDYVFTHSFDSASIYQQIGIPSSYMPFACNPDIHRTLPAQPRYQSDIALVANLKTACHTFRIASLETLLKPLINRGYDVAIWGQGWRENRSALPFHVPDDMIRGPIPYDQVPYVYASSKIILGVQNSPDLLTRRTFECLGSGGFLLTNDTKGVRRHFQSGIHLMTSRNPSETISMVDKFLREGSFRKQIASAAQREAHRNHTYSTRVSAMTQAIQPYVSAKKQKKRVSLFTPRLKQEVRPRLNFTGSNNQGMLGQYLRVGRSHQSVQHAYLWFDVQEDLLRSWRIASAKLKMFLVSPAAGHPTIKCYAIRSPWNKKSLQNGSPPKRSTQPIAKTQIRSSFSKEYPYKDNWYTFNITHVVREWLTGTQKNYGLCLGLSDANFGFLQFTSTRWNGRNKYVLGRVYYRRYLPRLEIIYENQTPIQLNSWSAFKE